MPEEETVVAHGRYGAFEGLASDRVVLGHYATHGEWSPELLQLACGTLRPATVIDVGANIGLFSIPLAERLGAHCLCLEPVPHNRRLLDANIRRHGLGDRCETFEVAAYGAASTLTMALSKDNNGDHHVNGRPEAPSDASGLQVRGVPLDALLAGRALPGPVLLKLDTQGCELQALRGAQQTLPRIDHCLLEYWPAGLRRVGDRASQLRQWLLQFPFGGVLGEYGPGVRLEPTFDLIGRLAFLGDDDPGFLDLLLTRTPRL